MKWLAGLLRRRRRIARDEFLQIIATRVMGGADQLRSQALEIATSCLDAGLMPPGEDVDAECLVFRWFLVDYTLVAEFPAISRDLCPQLVSRILDSGRYPRLRVEKLRRERSVEYAAIPFTDVPLLCGIAARRILLGATEPFPKEAHVAHQLPAKTLSSLLAVHHEHFAGIGKRFEIV